MILFGSVLVAIRARIVVECAALDYVHCGFNDSQCILRKHRQECLCHTAAPLITSLTGGAGVAQTLLSVLGPPRAHTLARTYIAARAVTCSSKLTTTSVWSSSGGRLRVNLRIEFSSVFLMSSACMWPQERMVFSNRSKPYGSPSSSIASIRPSL